MGNVACIPCGDDGFNETERLYNYIDRNKDGQQPFQSSLPSLFPWPEVHSVTTFTPPRTLKSTTTFTGSLTRAEIIRAIRKASSRSDDESRGVLRQLTLGLRLPDHVAQEDQTRLQFERVFQGSRDPYPLRVHQPEEQPSQTTQPRASHGR